MKLPIQFDPADRQALLAYLPDQPRLDAQLTALEVEAEHCVADCIASARLVTTRRGDRWLLAFSSPKPAGLYHLFSQRQDDCAAVGIGWQKREGEDWSMVWWHRIPLHEQERLTQPCQRLPDQTELCADLEIPVPDGLQYLPFQRAGVDCLSKCSRLLLADDMGLGKTIQVIGLLNVLPADQTRKVLIVCPNRVKLNWRRELEKWLVTPRTVYLQEGSGDFGGADADIVIINYDLVPKLVEPLSAIDWSIRVVDEAHFCKNPRAQRTKAVFGIRAHRIIHLTGTPVCNRPRELYPLLGDLVPSLFPTFGAFAERYCGAYHGPYGLCADGATHLDELQTLLRRHIMLRREKQDVLGELPPKTRQIVLLEAIELPADGELREAAREFRQAKGRAKQLEAGDTIAYRAALAAMNSARLLAFKKLSRWRRECGRSKVPAVIEHVREILDGDPERKVLVFAHHREVVEHLHDGLAKFGAVKHYGGMSAEAADADVHAFQREPDCRVFVGSIGASSEGINLSAATVVVFAELDWRPGKVTQAEDRAHRIGQKENVLVQHLVFDRTIDVNMVQIIVRKQEWIGSLTSEVRRPGAESIGAEDLLDAVGG